MFFLFFVFTSFLLFTFYFLFFTFYFFLFFCLFSLFGGSDMAGKLFRTAFDRVRSPTIIEGASMTKQSFRDECDINRIMSRYTKTGVLPSSVVSPPRFGDFSDGFSFQESFNRVISAQSAFDSLPAAVRARFSNDPSSLFDFLADSANCDEAVKLGLIAKPVEHPAKPDVPPVSNKPADKPDKA